MPRILETHRFGSHHVSVLEDEENEGLTYRILVDGMTVTDPLPEPPSFEDIVRVYSRTTHADMTRSA